MLFNSLEFWVFFAVVALACYSVPARWSRGVLVVASFVFYGLFNPALMLLLAGCVVFNHLTGLALGRVVQTGERRRVRAVLGFAVTANLVLLGFFKYYAFLSGAVVNLLHLPMDSLALQVVLPVAISFYTFEAISYNVDIYRREIEARRSLVDFALFISFFPHLVAGPIIRPAHFFPQLVGRPVPSGDAIRWGVAQIIKGLIKKTVFADNFALLANAYYNGAGLGQGDATAAWMGTLAFSMQIYFDFAGYTDIARGCARLLGYEFPPNFERPYLARDIAEFWRRWHISLSTWLRDYLYIPLGGNRLGPVRTYANLLITMGLGGLWHGASWNFVVWGLYHGMLLALHRAWVGWRGPAARGAASALWSVPLTFLLVTLGWVTFRTSDFAATLMVLRDLSHLGTLRPGAVPLEFWVLTGITCAWVVIDRHRAVQRWLAEGQGWWGAAKAVAGLAAGLLVIELFSRTDIAVPFIYFQF